MNEIKNVLPHLKLRLNIDFPSLEECYIYGYEAAQTDIDLEENPYLKESHESNLWIEGWWAGFYNEDPLFSLDDIEEATDLQSENVAANNHPYSSQESFFIKLLKFTSTFAVTALIGYELFEIVA